MLLHGTMKLKIAELISWNISNLCKGKEHPPISIVAKFAPFFLGLLTMNDEDITADILAAIADIVDDDKEGIKLILENVRMDFIVAHCGHENKIIQGNAVRIIGNICADTHESVEVLLNADLLTMLTYLVNLKSTPIDKIREICWIVSNIAAGPIEHITKLLNSGIINDLINITNTGSEFFVFLDWEKLIVNKRSLLGNINRCNNRESISNLENG